MLNIGFTELFIFAVIALLVLGPDKLPDAIRFVFKWYSKIKRTLSTLQNDLDRELRLSELREQMQTELARIQSLEAKVQEKIDQLERQTHINFASQSSVISKKFTVFKPIETSLSGVYLDIYSPTQMPKTTLFQPEFKVAI